MVKRMIGNGRKKCDACPCSALWDHTKIPVYENGRVIAQAPYREIGYRMSRHAKVAIVGESPGAHELLVGSCFCGPSGQLLDKELGEHGKYAPSQDRPDADVSLLNALRCHYPKKMMPPKDLTKALECCRDELIYYLQALKPELIVCFGDIAMRQVLRKKGITNARGKIFESGELKTKVFPTFHPAFILRDPSQAAYWKPDIARVCKMIDDNFTVRQSTAKVYQEIDDISFLLNRTDTVYVGLDTESQGLDYINRNNLLLCYQISDVEGHGYIIRLLEEVTDDSKHDFTITWPRLKERKLENRIVKVRVLPRYREKLQQLRLLMSRPNFRLIMHHGNHDIHFMEKVGIPHTEIQGDILDIQGALHLLDPDAFEKTTLGTAIQILTPHRDQHKTLVDKEEKKDMLEAQATDLQKFKSYSCADSDSTREVGLVLRDRLLEDYQLARYYGKFWHPITRTVLYEIEHNGIMFDRTRLPDVMVEVAKIIDDTTKEALALAPKAVLRDHASKGLRFSRKDLVRDILFSKRGFGLKATEKTESGATSTNKKYIERIRDELNHDSEVYEFLTKYLEWVPYDTLYKNFIKGYGQRVRTDGRLHPSIAALKATGRTGCSDPNLQNIPKRDPKITPIIRSLFIAPPSKVLLAFDYSQAELRWAGSWGRIRQFINAYRNRQDLHIITARGIVSNWDALDEIAKKAARQKAKPVNFGFLYGQHPKGFVIYARDEYKVKFSIEEGAAYREKFMVELYPDIPLWHQRDIDFARRNGFIRTALGRKRLTPNINSDNFKLRSEDERIAINTPIQGPASDSTLLAGLIARQEGFVDNISAKLVLFVHDELIFEVDEDKAEDFARQIHACFVHGVPQRIERDFGYRLSVPLEAECTIGKNLAEMKELRLTH
jgi:DNA polymerase-1